ncbi:MAG TPA: hypothetical protein VGB45_02590 [Abditibacterium sp.]|jgi:hypothetical protein
MIVLKGLDDWARGILATPKTTLNRSFGSWAKQDAARKSIEDLPFFSSFRPFFRQISAPLLLELHQKLRGQRCESNLWSVILEKLDHALPDEIGFDFLERFEPRDYLISMLGHSRQSDEVMWKLARLVDEALLTLAKDFYCSSNRSLSKVEEVLRRFPDHHWMLESLAHCHASSLEKRRAYEKAIESHPEREKWLSIRPEIDPNQRRTSYYDLSNSTDFERMRTLYCGYNPEKLADVARDDNTPDEVLRELENLPGSREVRFNARHNLRRREEGKPDFSL